MLQPEEHISIELQAKKPGDQITTMPVELFVDLQRALGPQEPAYARLLLDALEVTKLVSRAPTSSRKSGASSHLPGQSRTHASVRAAHQGPPPGALAMTDWYNPSGQPGTPEAWTGPALDYCISSSSRPLSPVPPATRRRTTPNAKMACSRYGSATLAADGKAERPR